MSAQLQLGIVGAAVLAGIVFGIARLVRTERASKASETPREDWRV